MSGLWPSSISDLLCDLGQISTPPWDGIDVGGRNSSCRQPKALKESRSEMLESLSAMQECFLPPKRVLFPESAAWECGGRATARPGLGSELRIMWQSLSTFFFC